ncbi:MAG: ATP-binding protein [Bacteroidetes bacterium]|nr:ATP-binding protein [Bacteroidota bacterium]
MSRKNNRETTFRFPFDINTKYFLVMAFVFFVLSIKPINEWVFPKLTANSLKHKIEKDVQNKIEQAENLLKNKQLVQESFNHKLSAANFETLQKISFAVFFYESHELISWNETHAGNPLDTFVDKQSIPYKNQNGYYIAYQRAIDAKRNAVFLFKIKNDFGINNKYFTKNFLIDDQENDFNLELSLQNKPGAIPIMVGNKVQYFISKNEDFLTVNDKNGWRLFFRALFFILFGVSIHTYYKVEVKKKNTLLIYSLLLLTAFGIRSLTYLFGFPNSFEEYALFSPEYFASDLINRSLGDLFINMCLCFWALLFFLINVQGKVVNMKKLSFKSLLGIGIFVLTTLGCLYMGRLMYRLVNDSVINFDTTIFYKLDLFSFIGILTFMVIFVNFVYLSIIARTYFLVCFKNMYFKYILIAVAYIIYLLVSGDYYDEVHAIYIFLSMGAIYLLQDLNYLKTKFDFNSYKLLIWMLFISGAGSFFLTELIVKKELQSRENYASHLLSNNHGFDENKLSQLINEIEKDTFISMQLSADTYANTDIADYLTNRYFIPSDLLYGIDVQVVDENATRDSIVKSDSEGDPKMNLSRNIFTLYPQFTLRDGRKQLIAINLSQQPHDYEKNYSGLLQASTGAEFIKSDLYSYAIYQDGQLVERDGSHIFPHQITSPKVKKLNSGGLVIHTSDLTESWLSSEGGDTKVVVVKARNSLYLFTTLFAYIFFVYFVTVTLYILGNIIARSNLTYKRFLNLLSLNLRLRIHFSILVVELISFIIIGYFTSYFLIQKVNEKMKDDLSNYSYTIQNEVAKRFPANGSTAHNDSLWHQKHQSVIQDIADRFSMNINLFDYQKGKLLLSSLPELYNREIISKQIDPLVFKQLKEGIQSSIINEEQIGALKYLSSYFLVRNAGGQNVGIVQIPFFGSKAELRSETTTIITTLINIYIFVFLASVIIAFFLTKSVTRPFSYIVKQFTKINLTKTNEPLQWFDSDEIGLLIKEYNRMLRKLENSTVLLAKTEREMAWREMAKQVAHEIKNPLTPMKLSLQMLERAIKNNASNVDEIAVKVTKTLVEQIDNLTLIATNFSNFAKLPISKNEVFALNELLYSVTGMYHDDQHNEFVFVIPEYEINILADKSQIIRVVTNIIQNAIQAIPEERKGRISLMVSKIKNNHVRLAISDNGEGISNDKAKNLFQPYFTTKTSGTGLGLAMCKDIIEASGGRISFESTIEVGTTFYIDLPMYIGE